MVSKEEAKARIDEAAHYMSFVLGPVTAKRMFGGAGFYNEMGLFFAIMDIEANQVYFKVGDSNRPDYEQLGIEPFRPFPDKPMRLQYYAVPAFVWEDPPVLRQWAEKAFREAAHAAEKKKPQTKRRRTKKRP